jgi:hypothetical protein
MFWYTAAMLLLIMPALPSIQPQQCFAAHVSATTPQQM